ncbi:MAG: branched-chain amino acid ABC transporter substrate-binding protein [Thermotoga sp.]|nr:MAG: branched-chain amino acid ABC transporter substrate-binding protein [Thermotoga sp.]
MRKFFSIVLMISLISVLSFGGGTIKIGVDFPMTGVVAGFGQMTLDGVKLAHEMYPTVLGKQIELVVMDNKSDKTEAANAAARLIEKERVKAIIGCICSSNTLSAGPIAERAHVPMVSNASTNPLVTQGKKYVFRVCFVDPFQGKAAAIFAYNELGVRKAAVILEVSQDYSISLAKFFKETFKKLGGKITKTLFYVTGDQDFTAQLTSVLATRPEVLFVPGYYPEISLLVRQARQMGYKGYVLCGDGAEAPELIKIGGKAVEGLYYVTHFDPKMAASEMTGKFVDAYTKKYHKGTDALGALGFDAYLVLRDAIQRAGSDDPQKIRDALESTKGFKGATGIITIHHGDPTKSAVIKKVENGKFVYAGFVNP